MEHKARVHALSAVVDGFAAQLADTDPATPVPTCPEWDVAKLIQHVGWVHRWVTHMVSTRATERAGGEAFELGLPEDRAAYAGWLGAGAEPLVAALDDDPAVPIWSFMPNGSIGWWARRMLHETTVHRADADAALGVVTPIEAGVATDGLEEVLDFIAGRLAKPIQALGAAGSSIHLHATDVAGEWTLALTEDGMQWRTGHEKATVAVKGPVADLMLLLWSRRDPADADRFEVFGQAPLLQRFLGAANL